MRTFKNKPGVRVTCTLMPLCNTITCCFPQKFRKFIRNRKSKYLQPTLKSFEAPKKRIYRQILRKMYCPPAIHRNHIHTCMYIFSISNEFTFNQCLIYHMANKQRKKERKKNIQFIFRILKSLLIYDS